MSQAGTDVFGSLPWGTHFCLFHQTQEELLEVLVPFLAQGLQNNELCVWIASGPSEVDQAKQLLGLVVKNLDEYIRRGQIEILDYSRWYRSTDQLQVDDLMQRWAEKLRLALASGYQGLRATGSTHWLEKQDWPFFLTYEAAVSDTIGQCRVIAMCNYDLARCGPFEIIDLASKHQFTLIKQNGQWQTIQSRDYQKTEAQRRDSEERFRTMFEKVAIGVALVDGRARIVLSNPSLQQMLGYTAEELQDLPIEQITHPEDLRLDLPLTGELLSGKRDGYQLEKRYVRKDGRILWGRLTASLIRRGNPAETLCIGMVEDITARKQAEQAIRKSQAMLVRAQQVADIGSWEWDIITGESLWSDQIYRIFGYKPQEFPSSYEAFMAAIGPENHQRAEAATTKALAGEPYSMECRITRPDGSARDILVQADMDFDETGKPVRMTGTALDITDRKAAQEALAASEDRYRNLFDRMTEGFALHEIVCDQSGQPCDYRFLEVNAGFEKLTGLKWQDVVGRLVSEVLPTLESHWVQIYSQVALTGQPAHFEEYSASLQRHYEVYAYCPAPRQFAVLFLDISERKKAEQALLSTREQLWQAQKMEAIGVLAGGVAHDFRNQLTIIRGYADLLQRRLPKADPASQPIQEILKATQRSADLTTSLLAFSRKQDLNPQATDLNQAIAELLKTLRSMAGEEIQVSFVPGQGLGGVQIDRSQFQQAIINLVANARDAMPNGGQLTIQTAGVKMDEPAGKVHGCKPGSYVQVTVRDTGIGMDEQILQHIFEPFFTTKPVGSGTGLGLAMVYGFVQQSGGTIEVHSRPGQGTMFQMCFPQRTDVPMVADQVPSTGLLPQARGTILLVEDEESVRRLARMILEESGYKVLDAPSGQQALDMAQQQDGRIDLLITDVMMPGMNGSDLARRIHALWPGLPVLYMSGYTHQSLAQHGIDGQHVHLLSKPFNMESILQAVQAAMHAAGQDPAHN